jgi:peptidyl-prolyl cis-trans isomerase SurA
LIKIDSISFENAAKKFSDDAMTRSNGGFITQGGSGNTKVPIDELDKDLYYNIEKMDPGNFSDPEVITLPGPDKQQAWRVLYLKSESPPHKCNLADDYQKLQALAFERKQKKALRDWITKYRKQIYFRVSPEYQNCSSISEFINK